MKQMVSYRHEDVSGTLEKTTYGRSARIQDSQNYIYIHEYLEKKET